MARAVHFGACLLFFGMYAFDRVVLLASGRKDDEVGTNWTDGVGLFSLILLPVILISGIAWFLLVALTMSDGLLQWKVLKTVWSQTEFGAVWKLRLCLWFVAVAVTAFPQFAVRFKKMIWLPFFVSGALVASLAWAGHGQEDSRWHLGADVLHLLVAGFWPAGLLALALWLRIVRKGSGLHTNELTAAVVRRFSVMSLAGVALLAVTGFVDAWYLVGSFTNLFRDNYGRWLLVKVVLFVITIGFGAVNLLRLKPRLELPPLDAAAMAQLRRNIRAEICLTTFVIIVVAILGVLPPPGH